MIDPTTGKLRYPIIQAPLAGCTDLAFRQVARRRGMEFCFLEMISAQGLLHQSKKTARMLASHADDHPLGAQLVGGDPGAMREAALLLEPFGFGALDINMGCPVRKVTCQGAGSALLKDPDRAEKIFRAVVQALKTVPVTVKIRMGFDDPSGREAVEMAKRAEGAGVKAVTVHGRTRAQGYSGKADWGVISMVKRVVRIPVIGNGDIFSALDARRMMEETGCDGVMIGRGGLGNPWIYAEIKNQIFLKTHFSPPTDEMKLAAVLEHLSLAVEDKGESHAIPEMRKVGAWYIQGRANASRWRAELNRSRTKTDMEHIFKEAFHNAVPVAA